MEIRGVGLIDINAVRIRPGGSRNGSRSWFRWKVGQHARVRPHRVGPATDRPAGCAAPDRDGAAQPGKNLTVICEVVAMTHLLRYGGVDSAATFNERLIRRMREKGAVQRYLEEDYE
jgi:HPr kinase/phosphorylase